MIRVAMDAVSGPDTDAVIEAAARASRGPEPVEVLLVAPIERASAALERLRYDPSRLQLVAAAPGRAAGLLASDEADALVAEPASLVAAAEALGAFAPLALAAVRPGGRGPSLLLDVGASVGAGAGELAAWALMGEACASALSLAALPRVAWLQGPDPDAVRWARRLLSDGHLRLVDDLVPGDLPTDRADVIVCDGVVGRVALGMLEDGTGPVRTRAWLRRNPPTRRGARLLLGAPAVLLGPGSPTALDEVVRLAVDAVRRDLPAKVADALASAPEDPP